MDTTLLRPALEIRPVELRIPFSWLRAGLDDLRAAPFHTVTRCCARDRPGLVARRRLFCHPTFGEMRVQ